MKRQEYATIANAKRCKWMVGNREHGYITDFRVDRRRNRDGKIGSALYVANAKYTHHFRERRLMCTYDARELGLV